MDEAKRFFRFVLPGLSCLLEFGLLLWLLFPREAACFWTQYVDRMSGLGAIAAAFVGSGGVGFLLGNLYHFISWCVLRGRLTINHKKLLTQCCSAGGLRLKHQGSGERISASEISRTGAWRIATAIWHARLKNSPSLKGANVRTDSLTSIVHGLGTLSVGTLVAIGCSIYVAAAHGGGFSNDLLASIPLRFWVCAGILLVSQLGALAIAVKHAQQVIDMLLFEELRCGTIEWYVPEQCTTLFSRAKRWAKRKAEAAKGKAEGEK